MKKIVRLTENDLTRIVKKVLNEQTQEVDAKSVDKNVINDKLKRITNGLNDTLFVIKNVKMDNGKRDQAISNFINQFGDESSVVNFTDKNGETKTLKVRQFANYIKLLSRSKMWGDFEITNYTPSDSRYWEKTDQLNTSKGAMESNINPKLGSITIKEVPAKGNEKYQQMSPAERELFAQNKRGKIKRKYR
jgi:hypothetical protein